MSNGDGKSEPTVYDVYPELREIFQSAVQTFREAFGGHVRLAELVPVAKFAPWIMLHLVSADNAGRETTDPEHAKQVALLFEAAKHLENDLESAYNVYEHQKTRANRLDDRLLDATKNQELLLEQLAAAERERDLARRHIEVGTDQLAAAAAKARAWETAAYDYRSRGGGDPPPESFTAAQKLEAK